MKIKNNYPFFLLAKYLFILLVIILFLHSCLSNIWHHLLRERLLRDLIYDINPYLLFIYFFLFALFLLRFFYTLKLLFNKRIIWFFERPIIRKFYSFIDFYIINSKKIFYNHRVKLAEYLYKFCIFIETDEICEQICIFIETKGIHEKKIIKYSLFLIIYLIKLLVSIIFLYDILFYHKFIHLIKVIPFLIIPTIFHLILYIIFNYAERSQYTLDLVFDFINNDDDNHDFLKNYNNCWFTYLLTMMTIDKYYYFEKKYKLYFYLIIYSFYSVGWGYLLFKIFFYD